MSKEIELPSDLVDALNKYIDVWSKTDKCPTLGPSMFKCPQGWLHAFTRCWLGLFVETF